MVTKCDSDQMFLLMIMEWHCIDISLEWTIVPISLHNILLGKSSTHTAIGFDNKLDEETIKAVKSNKLVNSWP